MTHASALGFTRQARRRVAIEPGTVVAALFFLALFAAEMALILHAGTALDPASLMGFVT